MLILPVPNTSKLITSIPEVKDDRKLPDNWIVPRTEDRSAEMDGERKVF